jgi:uncharacterized protein
VTERARSFLHFFLLQSGTRPRAIRLSVPVERYRWCVPEQPHITVTGEGVAPGTPDMCMLQATIHVLSETAGGAITECSRLANLAIESLGALPTVSSIRTTGLSVHDWFDRDQPTPAGRAADYSLEVELGSLDDVGSTLELLTDRVGDALRVPMVRIAIGDRANLLRQARRAAVHDARQKASEILDAAGASLGEILSITEGTAFAPYRGGTRVASTTSLPIEAGTSSVEAAVTITYAIVEQEESRRSSSE